MVRAFIASYDECVGKEEEETARTKKGKNILMARRRENASRGAFASQIPSKFLWIRFCAQYLNELLY